LGMMIGEEKEDTWARVALEQQEEKNLDGRIRQL